MSTDLIAALRAALDADEAAARAAAEQAGSGDWRHRPGDDYTWAVEAPNANRPGSSEHWMPLLTEAGSYVGDQIDGQLGAFSARHDPAFVLADIAAKRAVIDAFEAAVRSAPGAYPPDASGLGQAVRLLAEAYGIRADGPTI